MSRIIEVYPDAKKDLREIAEYIATDNPSTAFRFLEAAKKTFLKLNEMPQIGRSFRFYHPDLHDIRVFPVSGFEKFLIFYRPLVGGIAVIHVLHSARDIPALFEDEFNFPL